MVKDEKIKLYNGVEIPILGFGTWMIDDSRAKQAVENALKLGYRHIDTAEAYGNEQGVGEGIKASGIDRKEIFFANKTSCRGKNL